MITDVGCEGTGVIENLQPRRQQDVSQVADAIGRLKGATTEDGRVAVASEDGTRGTKEERERERLR